MIVLLLGCSDNTAAVRPGLADGALAIAVLGPGAVERNGDEGRFCSLM